MKGDRCPWSSARSSDTREGLVRLQGPPLMRGRLTAGRLALTQGIGVRDPASQSSRHHRLTDRPPGSQSGDRSSNLRGAIASGCGAVGSARGSGPRGRTFESCHPDSQSEIPKTRLRCVSGSTLGLYPRRYGSTPYGGSGVIRRASHRGPRQRCSRKVRTRMRGRPRIKPPRVNTPGDVQVALRGRAWQQRRMTAPAALAADAAGETGYRQRASNPKRPVSRKTGRSGA